jgi:hypothetical protein
MKKDNPKLASGRSPNWAFMERFVIPNYSTADADDDYLVRWRLIQTPWFGIYLHKIMTPDPRPTLHDHPWPFLAVVLRGGYDEMRRGTHAVTPAELLIHPPDDDHPQTWKEMPDSTYARPRRVTRVNRMPLDSLHWISRLHRIPTWTLVFVGRRSRIWGYLDRDGTWTDFLTHPHNAEFQTVMENRKAKEATA